MAAAAAAAVSSPSELLIPVPMDDFTSYPPIISNRDSGIGLGLGSGLGGTRKLSSSSSGRFGGEDPLFGNTGVEPYGYEDVFFGGGPSVFGSRSRRQSFSNQLFSDMLGVDRSVSPSPPPSSFCEPSAPPFSDAPIFDDDNLGMDHSGYQDVFSIGAAPVFSSSPFGGGLEASDEERSRFSPRSDSSSDILNVGPHVNESPNHRLAEDWKPPKQATSPEGAAENDEFLVIDFNPAVSNTSPTLFSDLDPFNAKSFPSNDNKEQTQSDQTQEDPSFSDWEALIFNPFSSSGAGNNKQTHRDGAGEEGFLGFDDFVRPESSAKHSPVEEPNERSKPNNPYRSSLRDHILPEQNVSDRSDRTSTEFGANVAWQGRNQQSLAGENCAPPKVSEFVESNDFWVTVDMINLKTQSSRYPPPERRPPPCKPVSGAGSKEAMHAETELRPIQDNNIPTGKTWEGRQGQSVREEVQAQGREEEEWERRQREWEEREQEMGRIAVDRASREARGRLEQAGVEMVRERAEHAMAEAKERAQRATVGRASAEARERAAEEANKRAQRAAVERVTVEARERAMEEARERAQRFAVERVTTEARERAMEEARERVQRAAAERAAAEARERAMEEARERAQRAAAEARQRAVEEARERAQRVAVERAAAEARERAMEEAREKAKRLSVERAMAEARERAAAEARDRAAAATVAEAREGMERQQQKQSEIDLESFFMPSSRTESSTPQYKSEAREFASDIFQSNKGAPGWPPPGSSSATKSAPAVNFVDDLTSIFGPPDSKQFQEVKGEPDERSRARLERHQRTMERAEKALEEKNQRDLQMQWEQEERHRLGETVDVEIRRWATGKEGNIRAMLSTLQYVLWPECGWQPVSLTDLITAATVKKAYRKATLCIHPDKVQQKGATLQQKYIAEKVFDLLKEAWNKFNSEELF